MWGFGNSLIRVEDVDGESGDKSRGSEQGEVGWGEGGVDTVDARGAAVGGGVRYSVVGVGWLAVFLEGVGVNNVEPELLVGTSNLERGVGRGAVVGGFGEVEVAT